MGSAEGNEFDLDATVEGGTVHPASQIFSYPLWADLPRIRTAVYAPRPHRAAGPRELAGVRVRLFTKLTVYHRLSYPLRATGTAVAPSSSSLCRSTLRRLPPISPDSRIA